MTTTELHAGVSQTVEAARWNGDDIAFSPEDGSIAQLLLVRGGMYVETSDGTWLHYADATDVPPKPLGGLAQLARSDIAATTVQQILALATRGAEDHPVGRQHLLHGDDPRKQPHAGAPSRQ